MFLAQGFDQGVADQLAGAQLALRRAGGRAGQRAAARSDAAAIAQLDWPALQAAVTDCRACGLCEGRHQTVFGSGHRRAHCMVVGEAPGEQEDLAGEPFVGPSGQLLDRMLAALRLNDGTFGVAGTPDVLVPGVAVTGVFTATLVGGTGTILRMAPLGSPVAGSGAVTGWVRFVRT